MRNLIIFGMQGAGKGTQSKILVEKFGFTPFETGAELRSLMAGESELAIKVRAIVERGDLVPNAIVMEIVEAFLDRISRDTPVLFDGIPRSMEQKGTLDSLLQKHERPCFAIFIDIPKEEALQRLLLRGRSDDNHAAIETRIGNYERETLPVIEAYEREGILKRVNGLGTVEEISAEIEKVVQKNV